MDVNRGHIVADINEVEEKLRHRYTPIPDDLRAEAEDALDGEREAYINPNRAKKLAAWAANTRKTNRARNKLAKASRARNR